MDHFAHYYNRFAAHNQGQEYAETQTHCTENRVNEYGKVRRFDVAFRLYMYCFQFILRILFLITTFLFLFSLSPDYRHQDGYRLQLYRRRQQDARGLPESLEVFIRVQLLQRRRCP